MGMLRVNASTRIHSCSSGGRRALTDTRVTTFGGGLIGRVISTGACGVEGLTGGGDRGAGGLGAVGVGVSLAEG